MRNDRFDLLTQEERDRLWQAILTEIEGIPGPSSGRKTHLPPRRSS